MREMFVFPVYISKFSIKLYPKNRHKKMPFFIYKNERLRNTNKIDTEVLIRTKSTDVLVHFL